MVVTRRRVERPDLRRLVYFSRNMVRGERQLELEIRDILTCACSRNAELRVSGALLFNSGGFAQVLEGELASINFLFERIQGDRRHANLVILENACISQRTFANWAMAHVGRSARDQRLFGSISHESGFDPSVFDGESVSRVMKMLLLRDEVPEKIE